MWIKYVLIAVIGFASGVTVSAGIFAFITMIGIIPRFAGRTKTAKCMLLYEDMVIIGATTGNTMYLYHYDVELGPIGILMFGLFSGIFIGCVAVALAEILNVIPVFMARLRIKKGISYFIIALALGKGIGAFYQLYIKAMTK